MQVTSWLRSSEQVCLGFLRKIVREEVSLMSDGSAFQARGSATKKALSVTWSRSGTWNDEVSTQT